jgi:hypothetical protein
MTDALKNLEAAAAIPKRLTGSTALSSVDEKSSGSDLSEIRMVDASALWEYEVWFFISLALAAVALGVFVAFLQATGTGAPRASLLGTITLISSILFSLSVTVTFLKRRILRKSGRLLR